MFEVANQDNQKAASKAGIKRIGSQENRSGFFGVTSSMKSSALVLLSASSASVSSSDEERKSLVSSSEDGSVRNKN